MAKYRKKPVVIEATRWFGYGDHAEVNHYLSPEDRDFNEPCKHCGSSMKGHGWIATLEGGHIVCPGDWIVRGIKNEHYPCKPDIFDQTYEAV